jgi:lambda repressor-like predicted transcriptional regulator
VAANIAQLLECWVEDLWPERYRFKPRGPASNRRTSASLDKSKTKPDSKETNKS